MHEVALPKDLIAAGDGGTFPDRSGHFLAHDLPDTLLVHHAPPAITRSRAS